MRISPPAPRLGSFLAGSFVLSAALGLACAGTRTTTSSPCLDRCTNIQSSLDRSTCELDCQRLTDAPASASVPAPAPAPVVAATPAPATPPANPSPAPVIAQPRPTQPTATPQPGTTQPRPVTPAPAPTPTVVGPTYAELQQQRASCETGCDGEPIASDRSTCRLQCAQITNRPSAPASTGTPTYVSPPNTTPNTTGAARPVAVDPQVLAACLGTCNDASTPDTDRATCRLQCNANGAVGPAPSSYYVLGGAPPSDADQRAAVIRSSQGNAGSVAPTPPQTPQTQQKIAACAATAQQCSATCNTQLSPCNAGCDQGKLSSTDRATCKLTCESNVDVCRDDCRIKEGSCRSKP